MRNEGKQVGAICLGWLLLLFSGVGHAQQWSAPVFVDSNSSVLGITAADSSIAYVWGWFHHYERPSDVGMSTHFFLTTDGGITWIEQDFSGITGVRFANCPDKHSFFFFDKYNTTGIDCQNTTDLGQTWKSSVLYYNNSNLLWYLRYASMFTASRGIIDDGDVIYITTDSGNTLSERRGTPAEAASVCGDWTDSLHVYLAFVQAEPNFSNDQQFPIAVTSDGGYDWDYIFADTVSRNLHYQQVACLRGTPYAIALARDSLAIVSFYYTSDWGATWKPNYSYPALIKQIALVAPNEIWAIANPSHGTDSLHTQFILHSKDTGHTWSVDSTTLVGFRALNLTFSDPGHGWIAMNKLAHADTIGTPIHYEWDENDSLLYVSRYNTPLASVSQQEAKAQERDGIQLYPNPATTKLNIVSSYSSGTIYLFDILGRESLSAPLPASGNATLDVSHLPRGVYSIVQEQRGIRSAMGKVLISGE